MERVHCRNPTAPCLLHDCICGCDGCDPVGTEARRLAKVLRASIAKFIAAKCSGAYVEIRDVEAAAELLERYPNGNR